MYEFLWIGRVFSLCVVIQTKSVRFLCLNLPMEVVNILRCLILGRSEELVIQCCRRCGCAASGCHAANGSAEPEVIFQDSDVSSIIATCSVSLISLEATNIAEYKEYTVPSSKKCLTRFVTYLFILLSARKRA